MHLITAAACEIGSSRAWGSTVTKCHWVSPRARKSERTGKVAHPRDHCRKSQRVQGVSGTVDDRALQLARVRRNRNEVGGAAYHRHQAVSRCLIRPAPPSQLPPVLRAANENRTFEPLEGWSRLWGLDDMQMAVHYQRATVVRTSGPSQ